MTPTPNTPMMNAEFDALHGGRELLPIEQVAYEAEGAERFAKHHGHGRTFPKALEFSPHPEAPTGQINPGSAPREDGHG